MQRQVSAFNEATGAKRGDADPFGNYLEPPAIRAPELRARLILEEALETVEGLLGSGKAYEVVTDMISAWISSPPKRDEGVLVEACDGGADLLYVTFGMFDAFGVNAESVFDIVHSANMTKVGAPKDANGKTTKPPGFMPPQEQIRALLLKMGAKL
jgi:predicted HAD superfamily Cof-like phosphohydrolase